MLGLLRRQITLQITCADSKLLLNALLHEQLPVYGVICCDDLVLQVSVRQDHYHALQNIAEKLGASVKILQKNGVAWRLHDLLKRPVMIAMVLILFAVTCYLPTRVLFLSVEGNESVNEKQILEAAELSGLRYGVSARKVRSETLKNALLERLPQLQWAGINVKGCTVVISVRERDTAEQTQKTGNQVCSIVASRDGIIQNCTVYQGNPLCTVGQAVNAGQTLVSGYLDYGIVTKATHAQAEVRALTFRTLDVVAPAASTTRSDISRKNTLYSLKIGKKVIKISKDSGNFDTTCAKIYEEAYLTLPGGFRLPVAIIKQTQIFYNDGDPVTASADSNGWLEEYARSYLHGAMIAGEIVSEQVQTETQPAANYLYGRYACMEMIGQLRQEQSILKDEIND